MRILAALVLITLVSWTADACTIFILTDGKRALFCNNEDWSNPKTRIWFVPGSKSNLGCAYVGFDDGWAQGGLNAKGLAFDWVAGFMEKWEPDPGLKVVRGSPSQRMVETCSTVEDAIAFYRNYREPGFYRAKILIADRTGASVIIGARDGNLQVEKASRSRGFGFGRQTLDRMLAKDSAPTIVNSASILRACLQNGPYATKYSNVFDLITGDIFLYQFRESLDAVKLDLFAELRKGGHYYDIPQIRQQLSHAPMPLLNNMKHFPLEEFIPVPDKETAITRHLRTALPDAIQGTMRPSDYTSDLWKTLSPE
jgi:hypothetical protein